MDSVLRFSDRVENYVKYRPSYPAAALDHIGREAGLEPGFSVADIGAGTGIFTRLLLDRAYRVFAVEPSDDMRAVAERDFANNPLFTSVARPAEDTGLDAHSVSLVTAAQAFHWFDIAGYRAECQRILRRNGWAAILWNNRQTESTPFLGEYNQLLRELANDYKVVDHNLVSKEQIGSFYGGDHFTYARFPNRQVFDWDGFLGRAMSSSYVPMPGHPNHEPMVKGLRDIFDRYETNGQVVFEYDTEVYLGQVL